MTYEKAESIGMAIVGAGLVCLTVLPVALYWISLR
jgi:hypothetical protein